MAPQRAEVTLFALACVFGFITLLQVAHAVIETIRFRSVKPTRPRMRMLASAVALFTGHLFAMVTALVALRLDPNSPGVNGTGSGILTTFTIFFQGLAAVLVFLAVKDAATECTHGARNAFIFRKGARWMKWADEALVALWLLIIVAHSVTLPFINDPLFSNAQDDLAHIISLDCIVDTFGWAFSAVSILASLSIIASCSALYRQLRDAPEGLNRRAVELLTLALCPLLAVQAIAVLVTIVLSKTLSDIVDLAVVYFIVRSIVDVAIVWVLIFVIRAAHGPRNSRHAKLESELEGTPLAYGS
ncbi:hypothetical protein BKA62DRAFT_622929 [Auriculariales sp. MPI-PUGE-AT-0066]|nr:hypothetical protein BKA62DRAFT_622929 [Auriculariales sp. MPI-PUGE-AT-0066]